MASSKKPSELIIMYAGNHTQRHDFVEDVIWHDSSLQSSKRIVRNFYDMQTAIRPFVRPDIQEAIKFVRDQRQAVLRTLV